MTRDDCERIAAAFSRAIEALGADFPDHVNGMTIAAILVAHELDAHGRMDPKTFMTNCGLDPDRGRFKVSVTERKRRISKHDREIRQTEELLKGTA